jgi:hypothetical protein
MKPYELPMEHARNNPAFTKLFSKLGGNTGSVQGTGLGLNIVKKYIEILNGSVSFSSQENIGSSSTVDLPLPVI